MLTQRPMWKREWIRFFLGVLSVDGMLCKETQAVLAALSQLMAAKTENPILHVKGWVNGRIVIVFTRLYYRRICRDQAPSTLRNRELEWYSGLVLGLEQYISCTKIVSCTSAQSHPIKSTPITSFAQHASCAQHPPPPTMDGRDFSHGYVPCRIDGI